MEVPAAQTLAPSLIIERGTGNGVHSVGQLSRVHVEIAHRPHAIRIAGEQTCDVGAEIIINRVSHLRAIDHYRDGGPIERYHGRLWRQRPAEIYKRGAGNGAA